MFVLVQASYGRITNNIYTKGGTLRFIIPKKADVCFIQEMQRRARQLGEYGMRPETRVMTVFTDEPLETRRKLDVVLSVSATPDGIVVRLIDPIETEVLLERETAGTVASVRYGFDLDVEQDTEDFLGVLTSPVNAPMFADALAVTA